MVVISVRMRRLKKAVLILFFAVITAIAILIVKNGLMTDSKPAPRILSENTDRVLFLAECGWLSDEEPKSIQEIIIPSEFNEIYSEYNDIQLSQGFDMNDYKGKTITKYVYGIRNYPESSYVNATLLIFEDKLVGGDITLLESGKTLPLFSKKNG